MAFTEWENYRDLLDRLTAAESQWSGATTFAEFDRAVRERCADLVDGDAGYAALVTALQASGDHRDPDEMFRCLESTLRPPVEPGRTDGLYLDEPTGLLYDDSHWYLPDGTTEVWPDETRPGVFRDVTGARRAGDEAGAEPVDGPQAAADPATPSFDEATGRWRRFDEHDGEYEFHHAGDDVWERARGGMWSRFHAGAGAWLVHDGPSGTWLHGNRWCTYDEVTGGRVTAEQRTTEQRTVERAAAEQAAGAAAAAPDVAAGAAEGPEPGPLTSEDEPLLDAMDTEFEATVAAVRAAGASAEEVSDDEIFELFRLRVEQQLGAGGA